MCMSCFSNADFLLTSGVLGAASVRVGVRQLLPKASLRTRRVTDDEAAAFVASLAPTAAADGTAGPSSDAAAVPTDDAVPALPSR